MKLSLGKNKIDPNKTSVKLTASEGAITAKEEINHEMIQNIENYFRAKISEDLDMNDLRFYDGDPNKGSKELTPDEAVAQLNGDYPLVVKHRNAPDAFPFVKRGMTMFTGEDIAEVPQHKAPEVDFNVRAFKAEPQPKKPGVFAKMLGFIGIKTASYRQYTEYNRKAKLISQYEKDLEKYEKEERAYAMAKGTEEEPEFVEDFKALADSESKSLDANLNEHVEKAPEASETVLEDGRLQIGDLALQDPKPLEKNDIPSIPDEEKKILNEVGVNSSKFKTMRDSSFMRVTLSALRASGGNDEAALKTMRDLRPFNNVPYELTNEMYLEAAKRIAYVDEKRDEGLAATDEGRKREEASHTVTEKEYESLSKEEKNYFEKQENGTYQDRAYLKTMQKVGMKDTDNFITISADRYGKLTEAEKKNFVPQGGEQTKPTYRNRIDAEPALIEKLKNERGTVIPGPKHSDNAAKETGRNHLTEDERRIVAEEAEEAKTINGIMKKIGENRSAAINEISHTVTDGLVKNGKGLDSETVYRTVRFGNTMKAMTDTPEKIEQLFDMAKNDPEGLNKQYLSQLKEHTRPENPAPAEEEAIQAGNGIGEVKNEEYVL